MSCIQVKPDRVRTYRCDCCGGDAWVANGYIFEDSEPRGVYFLDWTEGHADRGGTLTVSTGDWGDETPAENRSVMGVEVVRNAEGEVGFRLADQPHRTSGYLGRFVSRDEALAIGSLDWFWHVADHIAVDDPRAAAVIAWVRGERDTASI